MKRYLPVFDHDTWHWMYLVPVVFVVYMFSLVMWDTHTEPDPPLLKVSKEAATAYRMECGVDLHYIRSFTTEKRVKIQVQKSVVNVESGLIVSPVTNSWIFEKGNHALQLTMVLPASIPDGQYLIKSIIIWTPGMSLREHWYELPDIPFTLKSYTPSGTRLVPPATHQSHKYYK